MTNMLADVATGVCWGIIVLEWVAGGVYNALHPRGERTRTRNLQWQLVVVGVAVACAIIVVISRAALDHLTVAASWARVLGLVVLAGSAAFTLWARITLGTMWSVGATVKNAHQLRTTGPYGVTRHPIYTGLLGMLVGTTLLNEAGQWIVLFPVGLILLEIKIHAEERLFLDFFPGDYQWYRRQVPQIVPGLYIFRRRPAGQLISRGPRDAQRGRPG